MGGIYIPDVSLPEDGDFELWIAVKKDGSFTYNVRGAWQAGNQKAVPVPPHGRLIDADALLKKCEFVCTDDDVDVRAVRYSVIEDAPTIIPAEEEV